MNTCGRVLATLVVLVPATALASYSVDPTSISLALDDGESQTEEIEVTIPADATTPAADVYLLADTTGSMSSPITAVRTGAAAVVSSLYTTYGDDTELRFAVGNYKDFPYDTYAFDHQLGFTDGSDATGLTAIETAINAWSATGGADGSEGQFFALDRLAADADPAGGSIGWDSDAEKIIVWFGDAPAHDAICDALTGLGYDITEGTVTADLQDAGITLVAISSTTGATAYYPDGLDDDPAKNDGNYSLSTACGSTYSTTGTDGQATRVAEATGGTHFASVSSADIVATIGGVIEAAITTIDEIVLTAAGGHSPYVTSIVDTTTDGCVDIDTTSESTCTFDVTWLGECLEDGAETFGGTVDVYADGALVEDVDISLSLPSCNNPPVAVCDDVTVDADEDCLGCESVDGGSYDPDGDAYTIDEYPACDYELGDTTVTLTITDEYGETDTCTGTVTVVDVDPPVIYCPSALTITPPDAPISFVADFEDNCEGGEATIVDYDCWTINGAGKLVDKTFSCVVSYSGDTVTIEDSGGVGDNIEWTIEATDDSGNTTTETCMVTVVNPGKGKGKSK